MPLCPYYAGQVHARRDLFLTYLDKTFDEREKNLEVLFARLDDAFANNLEAVGMILSSITTLALEEPLRRPARPSGPASEVG